MSGNPSPFTTRTALILTGLGGILLIALLVMAGFGQEIEARMTRVPGPVAKGATGFQALHDLLAGLPGTRVTLARENDALAADNLVIATPDAQIKAADLAALVRRREGRPLLVILPKWQTERDGLSPTRERRVRGSMRLPALGSMLKDVVPNAGVTREGQRVRRPLAPGSPLAPVEEPQTISGNGIEPWISVRGQGAMLAKLSDRRIWILADPDLANNYGLRDIRNARAIVAAIKAMNDDRLDAVAFDLTLHYRPGDRNLVKLMLTPPFVAVTIALLAAALLAGWASAARFGPPRREARAIPFGKAALIETIAALTRRAGRAAAGGPRFAAMRAERLGARLHAPRGLGGDALADWLDTRRPGFAERYRAVARATDETSLTDAAQALHDFTKEHA
ncbi:hypothetical protein COC42_05005 [Sphingomonas spermidinifaciens]|uniref:DUF4350 domain-containing protein n=1 Tax=Sphingomonas spermidinifaciens TaxID=1141889 RepID=A0A2A4B6X5_9SPHN|nr:hypothetical protein [Sphingomonas spermidinifaciens]PCD03712.1 hypothetical protein COC42_05005 [Sphingomonas spermidinifaciens]